ncbi:MAG: hypothetical protein QW840_00785, partial [Candidatus Bathyarchaeia archaeon]
MKLEEALMVAGNPFGEFRKECEEILEDALKKALPEATVASLSLRKPANPEFGQLASSVCFETAKQLGKKPVDVARLVIKKISKSKFHFTEKVVLAGAGYINFHVDFAKLAAATFESAETLDAEYGFVKTSSPQKIIV